MDASPDSNTSRAANALQSFFRLEAAGGIVLVVAALAALAVANSPLAAAYDAALSTRAFGMDALHWINDGLMAVFFLLVALEIKREAVQGQLASRAQRVLPLACAAGGVALPALIYVGFNHADATALRGWAIPTATDIAFALGVLSLLGSRVPLSIKVLLSAIAVIDDLVAIVIIALFYTSALSVTALAAAAVTLSAMVAMNRLGVRRIAPYLVLGALLWWFVLASGVHATLAGVATGLLVPIGQPDARGSTPLETLEQALHPWVAFAILPLFAFANAGLGLDGIGLAQLAQPVPLGIALGLFVGKPVGIFGAAWLSIATGIGRRPEDAGWSALFGMAVLCGIGFTMSLFIGSLAFGDDAAAVATASRLGILLGSLVSALAGLALLHLTLPRAR